MKETLKPDGTNWWSSAETIDKLLFIFGLTVASVLTAFGLIWMALLSK